MNPGPLEIMAGSKVTLSLRVLGVRPDGFHELDGLVVMFDEPHDLLVAVYGERGTRLRVTGPAAGDVPSDRTNLVARALHALGTVTSRARDVEITVKKGIPLGAGLGGGSSDAAAVLRAFGKRWKAPFDEVMRIGADIGSDVPVCILGGAARMTGRGEHVKPVRLPTLRVLVVVPPFSLSTPDVYRAYDEHGGATPAREVPAPPELASLLPTLVNDLEPAAELVDGRLGEFRRELEGASGLSPLLAGSGSAYVMLCGDEHEWHDRAERVERKLGVPVHAALSLQPYPTW